MIWKITFANDLAELPVHVEEHASDLAELPVPVIWQNCLSENCMCQ